MGVAEISHRSAAFQQVIDAAEADLRALLAIPPNYQVLWMQGGGFTQFAATVLNAVAAYRIRNQSAPADEVVGEYVVTGSWSAKALEEGERMGITARKIADGKKAGGGKFKGVPGVADWDLAAHSGAAGGPKAKPAFVYYCDNETVDGVEFPAGSFPFDKIDPDVPVVCDMSSNFLSRPVDVSKYGIIYAGAQKNLGPSGVTVVIVRDDLLGKRAGSWSCMRKPREVRAASRFKLNADPPPCLVGVGSQLTSTLPCRSVARAFPRC